MRISPKSEILSNERAVANAGSGKTYRLVGRFIALACVSKPEEICALTFTRMAASEFLDEILKRLAEASLSPEKAGELSAELKLFGLENDYGRADFCALLRRVVESLPRLKLSTIDAFEAAFASAFANELGIFSSISVMDDFRQDAARKGVLKTLFNRLMSDARSKNALLSEIEQASYGAMDKAVFETVGGYVDNAADLLAEVPDLERWGNPDDFRFGLAPLNNSSLEECAADFEFLSNGVQNPEMFGVEDPKTFASKFGPFLTMFRKLISGKDIGTAIDVARFAEWIRSGKKIEDFYVEHIVKKEKIHETLKFPPELAVRVKRLAAALIGGAFSRALASAKSIGKIASAYEEFYARDIRMKGLLEFEDFAKLIASGGGTFERSLVEYRIDSRFKHWLLDEFQDTSRAQWGALKNLLDEVLQDGSGERTLFYVGDKKQSIYGFRGADSALFDEVFDSYSHTLFDSPRRLVESRRSSAPVIDAVNALFESPILAEMNAEAAADWAKDWDRHSAYAGNGENGCVALIEEPEDGEGLVREILSMLRVLYAKKPELSCAILTSTNKEATAILEGLRALKTRDDKFSVSGEIDLATSTDNLQNVAILSAINYAFHPLENSDKMFLESAAFGEYFSRPKNRAALLDAAYRRGFEGAVLLAAEAWSAAGGGTDPDRLGELLKTARNFDASGGGSVEDFLGSAKAYSKRESSKKASVAVMTIYKAKGLTFDVAILTDLKNPRGGKRGLVRVKTPNGISVINMPPKNLCEFDEKLRETSLRMESREVYDNFCKFYVACTRPRKALYMFVPPDKKGSSAKTCFGDVAKRTFANLAPSGVFDGVDLKVAYGKADWFDFESAADPRQKADFEEPKIETLNSPSLAPQPAAAAAPSAREPQKIVGLDAYLKNLKGRAFGSAAHFVLSKIKYLEDAEPAIAAYAGGDEALKNYLRAAFKNEGFARFFRREENLEVLTEYAFTRFSGGVASSGAIDRLMLYKSADGRVLKALIADYKTDSAPALELAEKYAPQLRAYKSAVADSFGLAEADVEAFILSPSAGGAVSV
ncbi:MAG: UvrD-helicase domain-containing protein [Opitutales bacterium]|nr:UvrD-helicase domain-containing protein [Opitutales bacterium]